MRTWLDSDFGTQPAVVGLDARQMLGPEHPVFEFIETGRGLDMTPFAAACRADGVGRPPYDPRMVVTLILYCFSKGLLTARQIVGACRDDLGARAITGNRYPSAKTLRRFAQVHQAALRGLLVQSIRIGDGYGLVDVGVVAGDGTFMTANAAMQATIDEPALEAKIAEVEQQLVEAHEAWWRSVDPATVAAASVLWADDDEPMVASGSGDPRAWRRVLVLQNKLRGLQEALAYLHQHPNRAVLDWQERLEKDELRVQRCVRRLEEVRATLQAKQDRRAAAVAAGKRISGRAPIAVEEHAHCRIYQRLLDTAKARVAATAAGRPTTTRVNTTDPSSGIMPGKNEGFDQRHNVQAMACANQFILAIGTHPSSNDKQALVKLLQQTRANLDAAGISARIRYALYDSGYASEANFTADVPADILLVSVEQEARQTGRLTDGTSTARTSWATMKATLDDPINRAAYKKRAGIIEPVFAQLFNRFGTVVHHRGDRAVTELHLRATVHNVLKLHRARRTAT